MSDLLDRRDIGTTDARLTCTPDLHLPGCHNPQPAHLWPTAQGVTACICGQRWWPGQVGTWHSSRRAHVVGHSSSGRALYEDGPWKHYHLHTTDCAERDTEAQPGHLCADVESASGAEAWAA